MAEDTLNKAMDIMNMAAYFAPGEVQIGIFQYLFSDHAQLTAAIEILTLKSLVQRGSRKDLIFISDFVQAWYRKDLKRKGMGVTVLKQTLSLMNMSRPLTDNHHYLSVYKHAMMHPELLKDLNMLPGHIVWGLSLCKKSEQAVEFGEECYEILKKILDEYHPTVLLLQMYIGRALANLKKKEEAIRLLTGIYNKSSLGTPELEMIRGLTLEMLAEFILKNDRNDIAESRLRRIIFHDRRISESVSESELENWLLYAITIKQYNFSGRAKTILHDVIKQIRTTLGPDNDNINEGMLYIAICLKSQSKFVEAMKLLLSVYETRKSKFGVSDERTLRVSYQIGKVLKKQGELKKSLATFVVISEKSNILFFKAMINAASIYISQRFFIGSLKLSREMLEKFELSVGENHPFLFKCRLYMGESCFGLNYTKVALKVFQDLLDDYNSYGIKDKNFERLNFNICLTEEVNARAGTLHSFAKDGDMDEVLSCIAKGEDIETKDANGLTPLHYASAFERVEVVRVLIRHGAKYSTKVKLPVLLTPVQGGEIDSLLKMVHYFFEWVKADDSDMVMDIASKDTCVIGARDDQGCTALHWAALCGHEIVLKTLLELGCDPTVVSDKGNSPLHIAALKGHLGVAETLLRTLDREKVTPLLDGRTAKGGNTPLHAAAEKGHEGVVRVLLTHGAVFCAVNSTGMTPVELCKDMGLLELVGKLFVGVGNSDVESVRGMLEGLDTGDVLAVLGARNEEGRTLVQVAMKNDCLQLAKNLVKLISHNLEM